MDKENIKPAEVSQVLLAELQGIDLGAQFAEVGTVLQVSDGVARIYGLGNAEAGELLEFENGDRAVVMNLEEDNVGAVLLGPTDRIEEGSTVKRTGRTASIMVSEQMLGRVIDPLGEPLDGRGPIGGERVEMPLERKAPGVIFRQPVNQPLQTGLKAIDAMIPIGRGQRELIIGDRQTGKTAIAVDTIINQRKNFENGEPIYCIYVAVGQKASTVASLVETLRKNGAMDYSIVVVATAADTAALQYMAPFAGAAIGEYFRDTGRHALVVYDDLSKQAVAYREVSLVLRRPSGREAYPGDIFYLHSRLLERAAKIIGQQEVAEQMNDLPESLQGKVKAGGSLNPASQETLAKNWHTITQEGQAVFKAAVSNMAEVAVTMMERHNLSADDIRYLVPHQANLRIIDATAKRMGLPGEKCMINIEKYGNTTSATLPLCLWDYESRLKRGDNLILAAFGGGFTWGSIYLKWAYDGGNFSK